MQETDEIIAMTVASIRTLQKRDGSSPFNRKSKTCTEPFDSAQDKLRRSIQNLAKDI